MDPNGEVHTHHTVIPESPLSARCPQRLGPGRSLLCEVSVYVHIGLLDIADQGTG